MDGDEHGLDQKRAGVFCLCGTRDSLVWGFDANTRAFGKSAKQRATSSKEETPEGISFTGTIWAISPPNFILVDLSSFQNRSPKGHGSEVSECL